MAHSQGNGVPHKALKVTIRDGEITLTATECSITMTIESWNRLLVEIGDMK